MTRLVTAAVLLSPVGLIAYLAITRARTEQVIGRGITPGLKGWLFVLAAGLWAYAVFAVLGGLASVHQYSPRLISDHRAVFLFDLAVAVVRGTLAVRLAWALSRKSRIFQRRLVVTFAFVMVIPFVQAALAPPAMDAAEAEAASLLDRLAGVLDRPDWVVVGLAMAVALLYARRSRRVAVTCVN